MARCDRAPKKWYRKFNTLYWDNRLPDDTVVRWGRDDESDVDWEEKDKRLVADTDTNCRPMEIRLSPHLRRLKWWGCARFSLLHEMVHVLNKTRGIEEVGDGDHVENSPFDLEMKRLALLGAFSKKSEKESSLW